MNSGKQPLLFNPIYKSKIWGGQSLREKLGKNLPESQPIGESWEISGYGDDQTVVCDGEFSGKTLGEVFRQLGADLVGPRVGTDMPFPLLYKFIDAHDKLSVQVHPTDKQAVTNGWGDYGKTECWYVVDAKPDARIVVGFRDGVTPEDVRRCIKDVTLDSILNYIPVTAGDVLFMPAGTVHAILDGTLIYEVQETSDTTFRLYDWGRLDESGVSRPLHIEESLQVLDTSYHTEHKIPSVECPDIPGGYHAYRVACRYFALEEFRLPAGATITPAAKSSFCGITVLDGSLQIGNEHSVRLEKGRSMLIPAAAEGFALTADASVHFMLSYVPDLTGDVVEPLRKCRVSDDTILRLGGARSSNDLVACL